MSHRKRNKKPPSRTAAEKVSLLASLLVLVAVVGMVLYLWIIDDHKPPLLKIERGAVEQVNEQFQLPVTIVNDGGTTATDVQVEGSIEFEGEEEISTITFDFVPSNSRPEGLLIFSHDPSQAKLRVISYRKP